MSLYIEEESMDIRLDIDCRQIAETVINGVLDDLQCPYEAEVNLLLTDDEMIREMNKEHRQIDRSTDVLSFPMLPFSRAEGIGMEQLEELNDCFHPETGELMLGDIVISKEHVLKQAEAYGHSVTREFAFLIAHSMLPVSYTHLDVYKRQENTENSMEPVWEWQPVSSPDCMKNSWNVQSTTRRLQRKQKHLIMTRG